MTDKLERVPRTELEKRAAEIRGEERYMTPNDQLVHLEVQGVIDVQRGQALSIAQMRVDMDRLSKLLDSVVLDREQLVGHVRMLQAECEQMHIRQNATDARLDVIQAVFEAALTEMRSIANDVEDNSKKIETATKEVEENSMKLAVLVDDLQEKSEP